MDVPFADSFCPPKIPLSLWRSLRTRSLKSPSGTTVTVVDSRSGDVYAEFSGEELRSNKDLHKLFITRLKRRYFLTHHPEFLVC